MSEPRFAHPENLSFDCTRCGDCCRGWQVMLGPGEAERLSSFEWRGRDDELADEAVVVRRGARSILARTSDGACVFLGAENQCRIHEHFGGEAKPLMCRLFPFGFLPVGDRVAVDVSFACRSVSEGSGRPLDARVPEWTKLFGDVDGGATTRHPFSKKYEVDGSLLWELEHHLLALLSEGSLSIVDRIRGMAEFMRLATTSDPTTAAARQLRQVMASGIPALVKEGKSVSTSKMDKTQRAIFFHLLFLLLNPTPPELYEAKGKSRHKEVKLRVLAADGYKHDKAHPWVDNRALDVDYGSIAAVELGFLAGDRGTALVERYLGAKIVGQRFMREGERELAFVEAVPRLLLMLPMLAWTAKALAANDGASAVDESHARGALRLLDRSYGEVRLSDLPAKQRNAWRFVLLETELAACACAEILGAVASESPEG